METLPAKKPGFIRRHKKLFITLSIFAALAFGGNYYVMQSTKKDPVPTSSIIDTLLSEESTDNGTGPVAKVNGVEISRVDYQNTIKELNLTLLQQGYTVTDATVASQIRQQALSILVNTELLVQAATQAGVEVSEFAIAEEYQKILTDMGTEEALRLTLKDMNITEADLRADIKNQLMVDAHVLAATAVEDQTITEEEVEAHYKQVSTNNTDLPSFDSIKNELTNELLQQKKQQVVSDYIQSLRTAATIEILI